MLESVLGSKILIIGAHPDDEVLGCGGLIAANAANGGTSDVVIVTDGTSAQYENNIEIAARRREHLQNACDFLGVRQLYHWDFPDMGLANRHRLSLNNKLSGLLRDKCYQYVFTHSPTDINQDHFMIYQSTTVAARPMPGGSLRGIFSYYVNSSTEWGKIMSAEVFRPICYLNIEKYIEKKLKALTFYTDELREFPHPRSVEAVRCRAVANGIEVGYKAAEVFRLIYAR